MTESDVRRALNRLVAAGYRAPPDPSRTVDEWLKRLERCGTEQLEAALDHYIATETRYFPTIAAVMQIVSAQGSHYYQPDDTPGDRLTPEELRAVWKKHGVDPEELRSANRRMKARRREGAA